MKYKDVLYKVANELPPLASFGEWSLSLGQGGQGDYSGSSYGYDMMPHNLPPATVRGTVVNSAQQTAAPAAKGNKHTSKPAVNTKAQAEQEEASPVPSWFAVGAPLAAAGTVTLGALKKFMGASKPDPYTLAAAREKQKPAKKLYMDKALFRNNI